MLEHQNDLMNTISDLIKYGTKITLCNEDYKNIEKEFKEKKKYETIT